MRFFDLSWLIWLLPALTVTLASAVFCVRRRARALRALTHSALGRRCSLRTEASPLRRLASRAALVLTLLAASAAALRPVGPEEEQIVELPAKNVLVLLDVSKSMGAIDDGASTRMDLAKDVVSGLLDRRPGDRIGLVSFAGVAFPECPVTFDRQVLRKRLDLQEPGSLPVGGTNVAHGLETAEALLERGGRAISAILMVSDGDNVTGDPSAVTERLGQSGTPILSIALGTDGATSSIPELSAETTADHQLMRDIAGATGGFTRTVGSLADVPRVLDAIEDRLNQVVIEGEELSEESFRTRAEYYWLPLSLTLALLFFRLLLPLRTKRLHPLVPCLVAAVLLGGSAGAQEGPDVPEDLAGYDAALEEAAALGKPLLVLYTGSDWSPMTQAFLREVVAHRVFAEWQKRSVVILTVDLPREGLPAELRTARRELVSRFDVTHFPTALFLDSTGDELGRLRHTDDGPADWVARAQRILDGEGSQDSASSDADLPEDVRGLLHDKKLSDERRAVLCYNRALEYDFGDPQAGTLSGSEFHLLRRLFTPASKLPGLDQPAIASSGQFQLAVLHHRRARAAVAKVTEGGGERTAQNPGRQADPAAELRNALADYQRALRHYGRAAALRSAGAPLQGDLARLHADIDRAQALLDFLEGRDAAIESTSDVLGRENRFKRSLEFGVTTAKPLIDPGIQESREAIDELVRRAEAVQEAPTLLQDGELDEYRLALEDIDLAPGAHAERDLASSTGHIQDALNHLVELREQRQQGQGEGEGEQDDEGEDGDQEGAGGGGDRIPPEGDGGEDDDDSEGEGGGSGRSSNRGDLRDRLLERLGEERNALPPEKDH